MKIKNTDVYGLEKSIIRSGFPMQICEPKNNEVSVSDFKRAIKLGKVKTGTGHDNFLKGIIVQFDMLYSQYITPQLQRYHWVDIISSQSKMHRITAVNLAENCNKWVSNRSISTAHFLIQHYNDLNIDFPILICSSKQIYAENRNDLFNAIISNLPLGYEMWMGISTNYLQLKTIYQQRKNHKLTDWKYFCEWCESLPMFNELILNK